MRVLGYNFKAIETIIALNVIVFIFEFFNGDWVFRNLGLMPIEVFNKPWTIITSMFVHAGFYHIFFNMFVLFMFGLYLERIVGEKKFVEVYFIGGIFASFAYVFTSMVLGIPDPTIPAVGASGAVFAVMGALVMLRPNMTILLNFFIPMPLYVWAAIYMLIAVFSMATTMGSVAHNAHLGGLLIGLYYGMKFKKKIRYESHEYGAMYRY